MEKSRTKNSLNNIFMGFFNQIVALLLGFISRSIFIKYLGIELLGINGLFSDILNMLSMADLGFSTAMVYSFYKPISENNREKISALINFYKKVYNRIAIAVGILGILVIPFLDYIINTDKDIPFLKTYYLISLAGVVISYLFAYRTSIITANQKSYIITRINVIINFAKTIIQILVAIFFKNYIIYLLVNLCFNFLNNYIASKKAVKLYPYIIEENVLQPKEKKEIFKNLKSIFIYKISTILLTATDNILISSLVGTIFVGYYSNYLMVSNKVLAIIQIIFTSLTASIGDIVAKENSKKQYEIFKVTQSISFIICGIIVTSFALLINDLITIWLGVEFIFHYKIVLAICLNMYLACVLQPLWTYREATGLYMKTKYIMIITAVLNILLSVILGKIIGISGILIASAISRLITYFWYEPLILFKEYFKESTRKYFISILINFISIIVSIFIFSKIFKNIIVVSWTLLFIKGIISVTSIGIIFIIIYFKSEGFKIILKKLKK